MAKNKFNVHVDSSIKDEIMSKSYDDLLYFGRAFLPKDFLNKVLHHHFIKK